MRFEGRSKTLLAVTKSKAKMYEFGLPEEDHIVLDHSPANLLVMTIGMLGDLCQLELSNERSPGFEQSLAQSRKELRDAARYFDAFYETKLAPEYAYYFSLLAASAYYLSDMPGSASVLISQAQQYRSRLTGSNLEFFLDWLLMNNVGVPFVSQEDSFFSNEMSGCLSAIIAFNTFQNLDFEHVISKGRLLRARVHANGTDRELLIADIIASVIKRRIDNSSVKWLPESSHLSLEDWLPALSKSSFIKEFWPSQRLLSEQGVFSGNSAIVQLPTSAGKTKSAEIILRSSFLSSRSSLSILIAPYRSLCREITDSFRVAFQGEDISVNQLSDLPQIDEWDEQILQRLLGVSFSLVPQKAILVATPEKLVYLLRHQPDLKERIGLLIFDEGHQFDTGTRGVTYELLLATLKRSIAPQTQIILISAVIANAKTIGDWLYGGEGSVVNGASFIATERSIAFAGWSARRGQLHYINPENPDQEEYFVPRILEQTEIPLRGRETRVRYFPEKEEKSDVAAYLAFRLAVTAPVAVFCGTKSTVLSVCKKMLSAKDRLDNLLSPVANSDPAEIQKLHNLANRHFGTEYELTKAIEQGILPHSRGVPFGLRAAIEYAMENSLARCVVCTSTLAQGVNLPIKYLVISGIFQGQSKISTRDFHNLIGRAGRSGKHTEGSIIFADTEIYDHRRNKKRYQWQSMKELLDPSNSEHCVSSLKVLVEPFEEDPFPIDPIAFVKAPGKIRKQFLKAAPSKGLGEDAINAILRQMNEREQYIGAVESYLLSLTEASDEGLDDSKVIDILQDTLAYYMASTVEKDQLQKIFIVISSRIESIPIEKRASYGKALLGLNALEEIESWLSESLDGLSADSSIDELVDRMWPLLCNLVDSKLLDCVEPRAGILELAKSWCSGNSYSELLVFSMEQGFEYRTAKRSAGLTIDQIIELCDNVFGYQMMLIVGAVADLMESQNVDENLIAKVRRFQASIKLGFNSGLEHFLYSKGIVDREICKDLKWTLVEMFGYKSEEFPFDLLDRERALFDVVLLQYPSYFSNQISH